MKHSIQGAVCILNGRTIALDGHTIEAAANDPTVFGIYRRTLAAIIGIMAGDPPRTVAIELGISPRTLRRYQRCISGEPVSGSRDVEAALLVAACRANKQRAALRVELQRHFEGVRWHLSYTYDIQEASVGLGALITRFAA